MKEDQHKNVLVHKLSGGIKIYHVKCTATLYRAIHCTKYRLNFAE